MWPIILAKLLGEDANGLMLSLDNGSQISVQQIVHLSDHLVVVRGRWAGSSEAGSIFLIPWERIVCCCFPRELPIALRDLIQSPTTANTGPAALSAESGSLPQTAEGASPAGAETEPNTSLPPSPPAVDTSLAQRLQELRQRLRQRLGQASQTS